jgi:predicted nucleic acid-binding protein
MKVLFDTSVLVASMVEAHPMHDRSRPWLTRAKRGEVELAVSAHSIAELYAVLSSLPLRPRISPHTATQLIKENLFAGAEIVPLSADDYCQVISDLAVRGFSGGITYDALMAHCADKAGAERLLTLNPADFERVWPSGRDRIAVP